MCLYAPLKVDSLFRGGTIYYNFYCIVFVLHTGVYMCGVHMFRVPCMWCLWRYCSAHWFIRACDFANAYPTNSKLDLSLCTHAQIIAMSCICVLCVDQLLSVCVYDLCLWIASSSELLLSFSTPRDTIHSGHYSWRTLQVHWHLTHSAIGPLTILYMFTLWTVHLIIMFSHVYRLWCVCCGLTFVTYNVWEVHQWMPITVQYNS